MSWVFQHWQKNLLYLLKTFFFFYLNRRHNTIRLLHKLKFFSLQSAPTTTISAKDISDYNYEGEWESTKPQHQDYDSLISISHQRWGIDFLPKSITVKRDVPRLSKSHAHPGVRWRGGIKERKRQKAITAVLRGRREVKRRRGAKHGWHTKGVLNLQ